jgi:mannose/cellobiose epimerase-like protein (N-acyl-D-glucosamine 2-epimerase family)
MQVNRAVAVQANAACRHVCDYARRQAGGREGPWHELARHGCQGVSRVHRCQPWMHGCAHVWMPNGPPTGRLDEEARACP